MYQDIFYKFRAASCELKLEVTNFEYRVSDFEFYCFD